MNRKKAEFGAIPFILHPSSFILWFLDQFFQKLERQGLDHIAPGFAL